MPRRYEAHRVAITGAGMVNSLGKGVEATWRRLLDGESGIRPVRRYPSDGIGVHAAATCDVYDHGELDCHARMTEMARDAADEALQQSRLRGASVDRLFIATAMGEADWRTKVAFRRARMQGAEQRVGELLEEMYQPRVNSIIGDELCQRYGIRSSPIIVTTACASGASAIQLGVDAIRRGTLRSALVVGSDSTVSPEGMIRFALLSALSTLDGPPRQASRPFSKDRAGFVMGEGAAAFVLEEEGYARDRGASVLGYVRGVGDATDTFHRTRSTPDASRIVKSMQSAVEDAGLGTPDIDCINAHGTGTPENDKMECMGISKLFGDRASSVKVTSNKSALGHTLSAAGVVEAVYSLCSLLDQCVPPTLNHDLPDPEIPLAVVSNQSEEVPLEHVLSNSFGFGGQNVSIVLSRS